MFSALFSGRKRWQLMTALVAVALTLSTCSSSTSSSHSTTPPVVWANLGSAYAPICPSQAVCSQGGTALAFHTGTAHPAPKGTVTVGDWEAPDTINPLFADQHVDFALVHALWGGCAVAGTDLKWLPDECTEVPTVANHDVSADGTTVTMKLQSGLMWSDGQPITADDFVYGWQTLTNAKTNALNAGGYTLISSVTAADAHTVVVHFSVPFGPYLSYLPYALPKHEFGTASVASLSTDAAFNFQPKATSGPYLVTDYQLDDHFTLAPNPHYLSTSFYGPFLKQLTFQTFHSRTDEMSAFGSGSLTLAQDFAPDDLAALSQLPGGKLNQTHAIGYEHILYNQANHNLANVAVRQALSLAVDKCAIIQHTLGTACAASVATTITVPQALDFDKTLTATTPDVAKANSLLDQAGFTRKNSSGIRLGSDGKPLSFVLVTDNSATRMTEAHLLAAQWQAIGVSITVTTAAGSKVYADFSQHGMLATGQFDIAVLAFVGSADPDFTYDIYHSSAIPSKTNPAGTNYGHITNPQLDTALQIERGTIDFTARVAALKQAQQIVVAQQFYVTPLYIWPVITMTAPALQDYVAGPALNSFDWNIADWWVKA